MFGKFIRPLGRNVGKNLFPGLNLDLKFGWSLRPKLWAGMFNYCKLQGPQIVNHDLACKVHNVASPSTLVYAMKAYNPNDNGLLLIAPMNAPYENGNSQSRTLIDHTLATFRCPWECAESPPRAHWESTENAIRPHSRLFDALWAAALFDFKVRTKDFVVRRDFIAVGGLCALSSSAFGASETLWAIQKHWFFLYHRLFLKFSKRKYLDSLLIATGVWLVSTFSTPIV